MGRFPHPFGEEAHEGGADAHGGRGRDVREDVGREEEVDGAVVGVEGRVEADAHGVVHDHGEAVGAEVDGRAREPAHGLLDRPARPRRCQCHYSLARAGFAVLA